MRWCNILQRASFPNLAGALRLVNPTLCTQRLGDSSEACPDNSPDRSLAWTSAAHAERSPKLVLEANMNRLISRKRIVPRLESLKFKV